MQKPYWNSKLTLSWNDLFNLGLFFIDRWDEPVLNLVYDFRFDLESNVIRLNWSWSFGNSKVNKGGVRKTGSNDERSRVN